MQHQTGEWGNVLGYLTGLIGSHFARHVLSLLSSSRSPVVQLVVWLKVVGRPSRVSQ